MIEFFWGVVVGAVTIGTNVVRTINVYEGKPFAVFVNSIFFAFANYYSIKFVVTGDIDSYIGFSIGASVATTILAYKNYLKRRNIDERTKT